VSAYDDDVAIIIGSHFSDQKFISIPKLHSKLERIIPMVLEYLEKMGLKIYTLISYLFQVRQSVSKGKGNA